MNQYVIMFTMSNKISVGFVMETVGVMFMSQMVTLLKSKSNETRLLVKTKGEPTEYQVKKQEDILKQITGLYDLSIFRLGIESE